VRRAIASLIGLVSGAPLALLGVLLLIYSASSRTETSMDLAGLRIDDDLVGSIALVVAGGAVLTSFLLWRRPKLFVSPVPAVKAVAWSRSPAVRWRRRVNVEHVVTRTARLLPWSPVVVGAAFLILFLVRLPALLEHVYWDSDAASATVIADTFGHGTVILERFGWFSSLWFELLTKALPLHRQLWEAAPYGFALVSVALLARASWKLCGRWAAAMTATAAVATSPFVSYDLVTLNYHTATWAATVVLAAYCLWLAERRPQNSFRSSTLAVLITVLAGTTLASDWLFAFVGLLPYAVTGLVLLARPELRRKGLTVIASAAVSLPIAWITTWAMSTADVRVASVPTRFAGAGDLWPNSGRLLRGIVQLANGDYFFDARLDVRSTLSFVSALLALLAVAAPFVVVRRQLRATTPSVPMLVYASFWAACVAFNSLSFVVSSEGTHGGYYLIPVFYAAAATVPLVLASSPPRRLVVAAGLTTVAVTSLINLADARTALSRSLPPVASVADRVVQIARRAHAPYGYADYWDASSLTWSKKLAVRVAPVSQCAITQGNTDLCGFWFNVNTDWYRPHEGNSFVLRDKRSDGLRQALPKSLGRPTAVYQLNDVISMYIYPYDVAARFIWTPSDR
jgi:hypothetical protein